MAYLLKDIMFDKSTVSNNDIIIKVWMYPPKTLPHVITGGKMVFEMCCNDSSSNNFFMISSNQNNTESFDSGISFCVDINQGGAFWSYKTGCSVITNNIANYNSVDRVSHIIIDYTTKTLTLVNAITGLVWRVISIAGYIDNYIKTGPAYLGFSIGVSTINPDVASFKHRLKIDVDTDLYNHKNGLPKTPPPQLCSNNKIY